MDIKELMEAFARDFGVEGVAADEDGVYTLSIDDMAVSFAETPDARLATWAEVCEPPPEGREHLYRTLMEAMFMGEGTGGAAFTIERETGKVYLHRFDALVALDGESFKAMLENFVNVLEEWRGLIADFRPVFGEIEKAADAAHDVRQEMDRGGFIQV